MYTNNLGSYIILDIAAYVAREALYVRNTLLHSAFAPAAAAGLCLSYTFRAKFHTACRPQAKGKPEIENGAVGPNANSSV